jgi:fatty-acyl-CoA synthase
MKDDLLRNPNTLVTCWLPALKRHKGKPVLFLGDTTLTGGQLADRISQYIQDFRTRGGRRCRRTSLGGPGVRDRDTG